MTRQSDRRAEGVYARHARSCPSRSGETCRCKPTFQAAVRNRRENKTIRKTFPTAPEAKVWRTDAIRAVRRGEMRSPSKATFEQAADEWVAKARGGLIRTRSGHEFKPSTLREYVTDLKTYAIPAIGHLRLTEVERRDVQGIVDQMQADGWQPSTIRGAIAPVRSIFRTAIRNGDVAVNPTAELDVPTARARRERVATPAEASALLAALPDALRALYATAFYGGLRAGELQALTWEDVDLAEGTIHVYRSWDKKEGFVTTKSEKGERDVPIPGVLRDVLLEHGLATKRTGPAFVFGRTADKPFTPSHVRRSASEAWAAHNAKLAKAMRPESEHLEPIGLHEARHCYVTLMYEAGNPLEKIGDYVGHSSTYITDRYRHLLPGGGREAAAKLDDYLARAEA